MDVDIGGEREEGRRADDEWNDAGAEARTVWMHCPLCPSALSVPPRRRRRRRVAAAFGRGAIQPINTRAFLFARNENRSLSHSFAQSVDQSVNQSKILRAVQAMLISSGSTTQSEREISEFGMRPGNESENLSLSHKSD